jgi:ribosomal protein S21
MGITVSVVKHGTENSGALIRRFTKRVQGAGIIRKKKGERYFEREPSKAARKNRALNRITKREKMDEMIKLGKAPEPMRRGHTSAPATTSSSTTTTSNVV